MAFLLILTGPRVDEVVELNPEATLTIGSAAHAHIQLADAAVADVHGQVYPAQGSYWFQDLGQGYTQLNQVTLTGEISQLREHDVLYVGTTFVQFLVERPERGAGAPTPGAGQLEPAQLEAPQLEAPQLEAPQLEALREQVRYLESERAARDGEIARLDDELGQLRLALGETQTRLQTAEAEVEAARPPEELQQLASAVAAPVFEPAPEARRVEHEVRSLRRRASDLDAALVIGRSGAEEAT